MFYIILHLEGKSDRVCCTLNQGIFQVLNHKIFSGLEKVENSVDLASKKEFTADSWSLYPFIISSVISLGLLKDKRRERETNTPYKFHPKLESHILLSPALLYHTRTLELHAGGLSLFFQTAIFFHLSRIS